MDVMPAHPLRKCEMGDLTLQSQSQVASRGPPTVRSDTVCGQHDPLTLSQLLHFGAQLKNNDLF